MQNSDQGERFYYRVESDLTQERIRKGDLVLVDPKGEVAPGSIVLIADPGGELRQMTEHDRADKIVGKVVQVHFNP